MNTHRETNLTRRGMVAGMLLLPVAAMAHEGHSASRIRAEAFVLSVKGSSVRLKIELLNLASTSIPLYGVVTGNAARVVLPQPVVVDGFGAASLRIELQFNTPAPDVFTMTLDFGEHGHWPVRVAL